MTGHLWLSVMSRNFKKVSRCSLLARSLDRSTFILSCSFLPDQWLSHHILLLYRNTLTDTLVDKISCFSDKAPWFAVANELNMFFLKATRQNLATPIRGLSDRDIEFIHRRMLGIPNSLSKHILPKFILYYTAREL